MVAVFAALVLLLAAMPAQAQEGPAFENFGAFLVDPAQPEAIYLNEQIDDAAVLDFRRARRAYPDAHILVLNSPGGLLRNGLALADEAFEAGFSTVIPQWAGCYSACAFIFLAGIDRIALGELGVHQFSSDDPDVEDAQLVMADMFDILGRFDTPQALISVMLRTPSDDIYVFTADEIEEYGINRGAIDNVEAYEAAGAVLPTYAPGPSVTAVATVTVDPEGQNREVAGTAEWGVEVDEGRRVIFVDIAVEDVTAALALAGPSVDDDASGLFAGAWGDAPLLSGDNGRSIEGIWVSTRGSADYDPTSFLNLGYEDEHFVLLSNARWLARDLSLLGRADTIQLLYRGGGEQDILLTLEVSDDVAALIAEALADWTDDAADIPLGDNAALEIARTAYLYEEEGAPGIEARAVWYRSGDEIAARLTVPDRNMMIDIAFSRDTVYLMLYPTHLFADGTRAIRALSIDQDLRWRQTGPGLYQADLGTADTRRMQTLLSRPEGIELILQYSDGDLVQVFLDKGASFDELLSVVADIWAGQPAAGVTPAAGLFGDAPAAPAEPVEAAAPPVQTGVAPDWSMKPTYGAVTLVTNFQPDPHRVAVVSGGQIDAAAALGGRCRGFIAQAPDYRLTFTAGEYPLFISAVSNADTTLVVNDPNGNWYCDDNSAGGANPMLWWDNPVSGQYDIWIGTADSTRFYDATLFISEIGPGANPEPAPAQTVTTTEPDTGNGLTLLATYRDWLVYRSNTNCFIASSATATDPANLNIDATVAYVNVDGDFLVPGFVFDYELDQGFYVTGYIDNGRPFDLIPDEDEGNWATLVGQYEQSQMVAAMRRGISMVVTSVTENGVDRRDTFSLLGFTAALQYAQANCR